MAVAVRHNSIVYFYKFSSFKKGGVMYGRFFADYFNYYGRSRYSASVVHLFQNLYSRFQAEGTFYIKKLSRAWQSALHF
jgi:hypothetical protein